MGTPQLRVQVPAAAAKDHLFTVRTLISHSMETGLRQDDDGHAVPRKIINRFVCRYDGVAVFSVDLHEAMAANPFIEFELRATSSGRIEFSWEEDGGAVYRLAHDLIVT
jgi:sulfur-oxidizing protein SoxZ